MFYKRGKLLTRNAINFYGLRQTDFYLWFFLQTRKVILFLRTGGIGNLEKYDNILSIKLIELCTRDEDTGCALGGIVVANCARYIIHMTYILQFSSYKIKTQICDLSSGDAHCKFICFKNSLASSSIFTFYPPLNEGVSKHILFLLSRHFGPSFPDNIMICLVTFKHI